MGPSESSRLGISEPQAAELAQQLYGLRVEAQALPGWADENFVLTAESGERLVLKVSHPGEDLPLLEAQAGAMDRVARSGISVPSVRLDLEGAAVSRWADKRGRERLVRVLTWLPGRMLVNVTPHSTALLQDLGSFLGRMDRVLADCAHPALKWKAEWDLLQAGEVRDRLGAISNPSRRARVDALLTHFEQRVLPELCQLRRSVIHNDANDYNILVDEAGASVTGLIDFGDMLDSALVNELAIATTYVMLGKEDPLSAARSLLAGYQSEYPLEEREVRLLPALAVTRLVVSVICSAHGRVEHPENAYLNVTEAPAWELLDRLDEIDLEGAAESLEQVRRETKTHGRP